MVRYRSRIRMPYGMTHEEISTEADKCTSLPLPYLSSPRTRIIQRMRGQQRQMFIIRSCVVLGIVVSLYIIVNLIIEVHNPPSHLIRTLRKILP